MKRIPNFCPLIFFKVSAVVPCAFLLKKCGFIIIFSKDEVKLICEYQEKEWKIRQEKWRKN